MRASSGVAGMRLAIVAGSAYAENGKLTRLAQIEAELDVLTAAWGATGTGALWRSLVYEKQLAQRVSAWTINTRLGGEIHVAIDLRPGSDPAAVRAVLDEVCTQGIDQRSIDRMVTRREAGAIWGISGIARRASIVQRSMKKSRGKAA